MTTDQRACGCGRPAFDLLATCYRHASSEARHVLRCMVDAVYRTRFEVSR